MCGFLMVIYDFYYLATGPRSRGAGPEHRAKKKFASNHKKRKEAPKLNGDIQQPPKKRQRTSPSSPHQYNNKLEPPKKSLNPNHIPKRTMPKYTPSPAVLPSARNNKNTDNINKPSAKELNARSEPKKFEQHGKVRILQKPNVQLHQPRHRSLNNNNNNNQSRNSPQHQNNPNHLPPIPPHTQTPGGGGYPSYNPAHAPPPAIIPPNQPQQPPQTGGTPYKVFPQRPQEIWNTTMLHSKETSSMGTDIGKLEFKVTFVWRAGCKLEWPFENISINELSNRHKKKQSKKKLQEINCSWKKDFSEIEKYMSEIRPGGKKQHLSHHWMLCEIHPYSTQDVQSYGDFCNYYKDLGKVSAAMCKSAKHQHLLFYLCPPDEIVLPEKYLDDIFDCKIPKGLLWCLIFIKNLDDKNAVNNHKNGHHNTNNVNSNSNKDVGHKSNDPRANKKQNNDPRIKDPRKREKESKSKKDDDDELKKREKERKRKKKEKEKEERKKREKEKQKLKEKKEREKKLEKEKKEKSASLPAVEIDSGNLLGMLDGLGDQMKHDAGLDNDDGSNDNVVVEPLDIDVINDGKQEVDEDNDITMSVSTNNDNDSQPPILTMSQEY